MVCSVLSSPLTLSDHTSLTLEVVGLSAGIRMSPPPYSLDYAHQKYALKKKQRKKNRLIKTYFLFFYSMTIFDFLSFHSFLSCLPLLVQLAALTPQEAVR